LDRVYKKTKRIDVDQFAIRSAFRKLKFLNDEIEDRKTLFGGYEKDFMRVVKIARGNIKVNQDHERLRKNLEEAAEFNAKQKAEEALAEQEINESTPDVPQKKLYRKIAKETHPDKYDQLDITENEKECLHDIFKRAAEAYETDDVPEMLRLALILDIDVQDMGLDESEVLQFAEKAIIKTQAEMEKMAESFVWMWGTTKGQIDLRVRLLDAYLRQTGHPPVSNTILKDIVTHHEDPDTPEDGSSKRRKRKPGTRPKKLIR